MYVLDGQIRLFELNYKLQRYYTSELALSSSICETQSVSLLTILDSGVVAEVRIIVNPRAPARPHAQRRKMVSSPRESIKYSVDTTIIFNGTLKKFIIAALLSSGIIRPRKDPMQGKYMPQHASNTMNAINIIFACLMKTGTANAHVAVRKTTFIRDSIDIFIVPTARENTELPTIMAIMNAANMRPCKPPSVLKSSFATFSSIGVHMNTNKYIEPSNSDCMSPSRGMRRSLRIALIAFVNVPCISILASP
mmetsp:Transcript_4073/g.4493  ORF Transcript_4073/g.4493 Transcript_4073/m.4493 type:complete len:251 (-) Transcript_4073:740-1492(-)